MSNDSTSPGYLTPTDAGPAYDASLEDALSRWIQALSGLPEESVRPRTQNATPAASVCEFALTAFTPDAGAAMVQQDDRRMALWRHEAIECAIAFYGPEGQRYAAQFRDGACVSQNNDTLSSAGLSLSDMPALIPSNEFINNQWVRRCDITVHLRRKVVREYGINTLAEAPVTFFGE